MKNKNVNFIDFIAYYMEIVGAVLLFVIAASTMLQVFLRYVFKTPLMWNEELVRIAFVWIVWLGAAIAVHKQSHMSIKFFQNYLSFRKQLYLETFLDILGCLFMGVVIAKGFHLSNFVSYDFYPITGISYKYIYFSSVIGGLLIFFFLTVKIISNIKTLKREKRAT